MELKIGRKIAQRVINGLAKINVLNSTCLIQLHVARITHSAQHYIQCTSYF